jgi:PIN domain nuclease of toxin-antitoxin system
VKLLLDTHAALWFLSADERLGEQARQHLLDDSNPVLISAAVAWEIAIKRSLGKLVVPENALRALLEAGARPLPVSIEHAEEVERLPLHHRDPFDRMLVAQARTEGAALVTRDSALQAYGVSLIW